MDFSSQVQNISSSQLDALFEGGDFNPTPGPKELIVGQQHTEENNPFLAKTSNPNIPSIDLENLDEIKVEDNKDPVVENKDGVVVEDKGNEGGDEGKNTEETDNQPNNTEDVEQINSVLKNTVGYLIEKGLWNGIENFDELEITPDVYADIAAKQEEAKLDQRFNELLDSTGSYGKAIISHIKNGGDPDEVIDIFKEQKQVQNIDLTDESGQQAIISKYYSEVVGWNKAKIDRYINTLKGDEDGLETEAKELQSKFDKIYEDQIAAIEEQNNNRQKQKAKEQQEYITTLSTTIDNFENFTDKEKKLVKDSVLKFNKKLDDGTSVNDFYMKFYEIQRDPKEYVELIHYVMDKKGYKEKINKTAETKATDKTWNFVKNNGSITKKSSNIVPTNNSKTSKIDFSGVLNK